MTSWNWGARLAGNRWAGPVHVDVDHRTAGFMQTGYKRLVKDAHQLWFKRTDHTSWKAHQIRRELISKVSAAARTALRLIQTCVALCPLLGLLGTVTGMIEVFEVMAISGSGNPRSMASGVSKATVPTMAGMVAALSGVAMGNLFTNQGRAGTRSPNRQPGTSTTSRQNEFKEN